MHALDKALCLRWVKEAWNSVTPETNSSTEHFYLQPIELKPNGEHWFTLRPIDKNKIKNMLKNMMSSANVEGEYTNQNL